MSKENITISFDEAKNRLPEGNKVHTYRQSGFTILGADWDKKEVLKILKKYEIRKTGGMAKSMNHGLAIFDDSGWLFIETKKPTEVESKEKSK